MKAIITGARGTVGSALSNHLTAKGHQVVAWDRAVVPIDRYPPMEDFVRQEQPDVLFHLAIASRSTGVANESWLVNYEWASELAWITGHLGVRFVFTSSVMVFSDNAKGPFTVDSKPDATKGYGYKKRMAEQRVFFQNPDAVVARLGWQIGDAAGSNNMIDFFEKRAAADGHVPASRQWFPACSFVLDTVAALSWLATAAPGLYLIDSNTRWNFHEIASALNEKHGRHWNIVANDDFVFDQRMVDPRVPIPSLQCSLPTLS
ncbi:MAG: NAD-dependent epimerase/dehydratase family protein [Verrucomicrobiia bacterium]